MRKGRVDVYKEYVSNLKVNGAEKYRGTLFQLVITKDKNLWNAYLQGGQGSHVTLYLRSNGRRTDMKVKQEFEWFYEKVRLQLQSSHNLEKYMRFFESMNDMAMTFYLNNNP